MPWCSGHSLSSSLEILTRARASSPSEIESIRYEMPFSGWQEIADPPKFDPRNRETADHSMPYMLARGLLDGDIYLDAFTKEKFMDPAARDLMAKMTFYPQPDWTGNAYYDLEAKSAEPGTRAQLFEMLRENLRHAGMLEYCPAGIVLSGGGSRLPGLMDIADSVLRKPVRMAWPAPLG